MTQAESRQQKAELLLEHQESKETLANFNEKASRFTSILREVADAISEQIPARSNIGFPVVDDSPLLTEDEERYRNVLNFDNVKRLLVDLAAAKHKLHDLDSRKHALGMTL